MTLDLHSYGAFLKRYLRPLRTQILLLGALVAGSITFQLINPQLLRYFIDRSQAGDAERDLLRAAALFLVIAILARAASLAATYVSQNVGWRATNRLRSDLALHCLRLDMNFHKVHTPGELIERVDGDVSTLANFFSELVIRVLGNGVLAIAILVLLYAENLWVGVGLTLYAVVTLGALHALQPFAVRRWGAARAADAALAGFLEERLGATEDIRANGAEEHVMVRLYALMRDVLERARAARATSALTEGITRLGYSSALAIGLGVGAILVLHGDATLGTAYLFVAYIRLLAVPLEQIRTQMNDLQQAGAGIERVRDLLSLPATPLEMQVESEPPRAQEPLSVTVEGLSFAYDADTPVLHDLSFSVPAGAVVGVLGRTGSGKSTLARLLLRLYEPGSGRILLGGIPLGELPLREVRRRVAMVTQEVQLFGATVRDNLAFFDPTIEDARLLESIEALGLRAWYDSLPEGLDTRLQGGGQGLSAGEGQLLAFARVFLQNPGLVLLDEASSRLDPATEQLLEHAVTRLLAGRTGILIAHRLATIQRADWVLILEEGRLAEFGPRERLAADLESRLYRLLQVGLEEVLA